MRNRRIIAWAAVAAAALLTLPVSAQAQNGHVRQGVGAVNASMGGAGVASTQSVLGSFFLNPATLVGFDGTRMELSLDFTKPEHEFATATGALESEDEFSVFPSVGVSSPVSDRVTLGLGAFQLGGFETRYAGSLGAGAFAAASRYEAVRFTPAVSFAVSDAFWLGGSLLVDWTSFQQDPLIVAPPTTGTYPNAVGGDTEIGIGFQAGLLWNVNDFVAIGASYASKTGVSEYTLPATAGAPGPTLGDLQFTTFQVETPAMLVGGLAMTPLPSLLLAADVRYLFYEDAAGFKLEGDSPFASDGSLAGFGWQKVFVFNIGAEYSASDKVALRAGYNHGDAAVTDELVSVNLTTPGLVKDHLSFGIGWQPTRRFRIDAGYVIALESTVTGPVLTPAGALAESVSLKSGGNAFQLAFAMGTRGF